MNTKSTVQPAVLQNQAATAPDLKLYTLENAKGTTLQLSALGAGVVSLKVADRDGRPGDVVLGYQHPQEYFDDRYYLGTVVGRYANRIAGDTVVIDGRSYKLTTRDGGYHLHGGHVGFNKKIFMGEMFSSEQGNSSGHDKPQGVIFRYTSPDLEEGFPGEFTLEVTYTLSDNDEWTVEYRGRSTKTTIVNLTQHTYFNLTGNPAVSIDGHDFCFNSKWYLPVNELQVPTGEIAPVKGTPFDFSTFRKITPDVSGQHEQLRLSNGYDHSFVLEKQATPELKHAVTVRELHSGRVLKVYTTEPAVHFYTGNFLDSVKGKDNISYHQRAGFCLETQHFPDAPNHPHFPSTLLKAGEEFYSKTVFAFSRLR